MKTQILNIATLLLLFAIGLKSKAEGGNGEKDLLKQAPRTIRHLSVNEFTSANLQIVKQARLDATPKQLWAYIGKSETLPQWVKQVKKVDVKYDESNAEGQGSERFCSFGGSQIHEEVVHVEPLKVFAYSATDNEMISNHLGVIHVEQDGDQSIVTWYQYFDKGSKGFKASMMKMMMPGMLKKALKKLGKLAA